MANNLALYYSKWTECLFAKVHFICEFTKLLLLKFWLYCKKVCTNVQSVLLWLSVSPFFKHDNRCYTIRRNWRTDVPPNSASVQLCRLKHMDWWSSIQVPANVAAISNLICVHCNASYPLWIGVVLQVIRI